MKVEQVITPAIWWCMSQISQQIYFWEPSGVLPLVIKLWTSRWFDFPFFDDVDKSRKRRLRNCCVIPFRRQFGFAFSWRRHHRDASRSIASNKSEHSPGGDWWLNDWSFLITTSIWGDYQDQGCRSGWAFLGAYEAWCRKNRGNRFIDRWISRGVASFNMSDD